MKQQGWAVSGVDGQETKSSQHKDWIRDLRTEKGLVCLWGRKPEIWCTT